MVSRLRNEYVVCARGEVQARKDPNKNMPTGDVELVLSEVRADGAASVGPFLHSVGAAEAQVMPVSTAA